MSDLRKLSGQIKRDLSPFCSRIDVAGSIRRGKKDPRDIDMVCIPKDKPAIDSYFAQRDHFRAKGDKIISSVIKGAQVDVYFAKPDNYGAMLLHTTGPAGYSIGLRVIAKRKGFKLNQYGLWKGNKLIASRTEEDILSALGKHLKPPSERGKDEKKLKKVM